MNKIYRLLTVVLFVFVSQACTTSGGMPQTGSALSADPAASHGESRSDRKGNFAPAVVGIAADPGPATTYRIGPHDLLRIEVFQVEELSSEERVNDEGLIVMPLIGNIKVGRLTPQEAEQVIADRLGASYLQNPQVNIFVTEYASQKVTVSGQVNKPGVFPLTGQTTLMQAIALAGGVDDVAKKSEIVIFRKQQSGAVDAYVVDLEAIEEGRLTDPVITADDRVVVPKSGAAVLAKGIGRVLTGWAVRAPLY